MNKKTKTFTGITHYNGDRPFIVHRYKNGQVIIYERCSHKISISKIFKGEDNSSILLKLKPKLYCFIGGKMYYFKSDESIIRFSSPIGNSDVPYSFAETKSYYYLFLEKLYFEKTKSMESNFDPYTYYYDNYKIKTFAIKEIKYK